MRRRIAHALRTLANHIDPKRDFVLSTRPVPIGFVHGVSNTTNSGTPGRHAKHVHLTSAAHLIRTHEETGRALRKHAEEGGVAPL